MAVVLGDTRRKNSDGVACNGRKQWSKWCMKWLLASHSPTQPGDDRERAVSARFFRLLITTFSSILR